jgi:hypothetical protein
MPLVPAFLVAGLPEEPAAAAEALGLSLSLFVPARDGAWQADFDLPRGASWRLLPEQRAALWIARDPAVALPPMRSPWHRVELRLLDGLLRLGELEHVWLAEAALLDPASGWTPVYSGGTAMRLLAATPDIGAVSGIWSDDRGRAIHAEIYRDGRILAESHSQAERWLLAAAGSPFGPDTAA